MNNVTDANERLLRHLTISAGLNALLLVACIVVFGAKGTVIVAFFLSLGLILQSLGVMVSTGRDIVLASPGALRLGPLTFTHCHHVLSHDISRHAFLAGGKFFCAGCHGIACGTLLSLAIPGLFLAGIVDRSTGTAMLPAAAACFLPAMLRVICQGGFGVWMRFWSYGLLPIGCWTIIVGIHARFESGLINILTLISIAIGWNLAGFYFRRQDAGRPS